MDFLLILVLALYITQALAKSRTRKNKEHDSDEGSIENLLYYKDCQRNAKPAPVKEVMPLRYALPPTTPPPPRQPECPFPKMCCALTCGNECGGSQPAPSHMMTEKPNPFPQLPSPGNVAASIRRGQIGAAQPQLMPRRKKRIRPMQNNMQPPFPSRRDFSGLTKDKIKGLIEKDDDIRHILKDLVRVTMQKVDLQDMISAHQQQGYHDVNTERTVSSTIEDSYLDDYVE